METKICSKCEVMCLKTDFHKNRNTNGGLHTYCKQCRKQYYNYDRERAKDIWKRYYKTNRKKVIDSKNNYNKNNRDKINYYNRNRRNNDPEYQLSTNSRNRTYKAVKLQIVKKENKTFDLLGCSHSFFKKWIKSQLYGEIPLQNYGSV